MTGKLHLEDYLSLDTQHLRSAVYLSPVKIPTTTTGGYFMFFQGKVPLTYFTDKKTLPDCLPKPILDSMRENEFFVCFLRSALAPPVCSRQLEGGTSVLPPSVPSVF